MSLLCIVVGLLGISALVLPLSYYAEAQTIPIPEFKPKAPEVQDNGGGQQEPQAEPEPPGPSDFAMKVQLEPTDNEFLEDYYDVTNFAIATSNSSELCPTGNCEFDLDGGQMGSEVSPGERNLNGKLRVDEGGSTRILNLNADWQTVEEREQDGERVQVIEGTLNVGRGEQIYVNPEYQSQINGTLVPDGDGFILEAQGVAGSPYDLE